MYTVLLVAHTILVIFLIIMVLIQRSDSDGMGSLGGGGNQFMTGRSTANFMTRTTAILAAAFMITSVALATMASRIESRSIVDSVNAEESAKTENSAEKNKQTPIVPTSPSAPKPE